MKIGKHKLKFYLSSGQIVEIKCQKFTIDKLTGTKGNRQLKIEKPNKVWTIDIDEVHAVTSEWCLF